MKKLKLNPSPAKPVRLVTTVEGKFLNLEDMKDRLRDDGVIDNALANFVVGKERGDHWRDVMRYALGSLLKSCAGEDPRK
jgi:hypothetical protein